MEKRSCVHYTTELIGNLNALRLPVEVLENIAVAAIIALQELRGALVFVFRVVVVGPGDPVLNPDLAVRGVVLG